MSCLKDIASDYARSSVFAFCIHAPVLLPSLRLRAALSGLGRVACRRCNLVLPWLALIRAGLVLVVAADAGIHATRKVTSPAAYTTSSH